MRLFVLLIATLVTPAMAAPSADAAFSSAKAEYAKLKGDSKRRAMRHHWQNVAKKFEAIARKHPKSERAPEALFNAAQLNNELSRISLREDDREAAKRNYKKLIEGWPKHRLADDAALAWAKLLADREDDSVAARRVLETSMAHANDKKKEMQAMLAALPAPLPSARSKGAAEARGARAGAPREPLSADDERGPEKQARAVSEESVGRKLAVAEPDPAAPVAPPPTSHAERSAPERANDVADAIRRAIKPLSTATPAVHARRTPPTRPAEDEAATNESDESPDEVVEPSEPVVASLAERLRDVRVGSRQERAAEDDALRLKLKRIAKDEKGAELSLAQQLGLKVRRVIIDAGHGGHDTGAIGPKGTREKDVSLAIAKKLAERLEAAGLEVLLTRDDDTYVKLEDRTRFANRQKGDLFISVHCNAAPSKTLRGIETYTLNTSSNRYSIRLAARENATTERGVGDLQYILADLATKANTGESVHLAERVQRSLIRNLGSSYKNVKDLGTKEALFFVLLGAKMPAILVETSFLSNPEEEERLADEDYQGSVADSIAEAVSGFLEERNKVAQID